MLEPVGRWWLQQRTGSGWSAEQLPVMLALCAEAVEILSSYELLLPERAVASGWMEPAIADPYGTGWARTDSAADVNIDITSQRRSWPPEMVKEIRALAHPAALYPVAVTVTGPGVVLEDGNRRRQASRLLEVNAMTLVKHIVEITTYSDVWLPYSTRGEPQFELRMRNAPRLQAALRVVTETLDLEAVIDEMTAHARQLDDFSLDNRRDVDGDLIVTS